MISLPLLVTFKFSFTVNLAFLRATLCLWLHRSADLWILCVHLPAIRISGTTCSQPFSPLFLPYDVRRRNLKARCSSCRLRTPLSAAYLTDRYADDEGPCPPAPRSPLPPTKLVGWLGASSPAAAAEPLQPVSGRRCGRPSPGAGPYPATTSPLRWVVQGLSTLQAGSLQPSNLLLAHLTGLCRAALLPL